MINKDMPGEMRKGEELPLKALSDYLKLHAAELGEITNVTQFLGGFSNLTYCLHTPRGDYILRRPPFGAHIKSAHDMSREFRVLSLLQPHYDKVPRPVLFCDDDSIMGCPFYIMERIAGVILRASHASPPMFPPDVWRKISEAVVDNLVALHAIDIYTTGLIQLGKPEGYVGRQVYGWIKRYYDAATDCIVTLDETARWLQQNIPPENAPALLHNDYKYDNVVLREDDLSEIIGVLDWEMSTVGDPLMDLGATLAYWSEPEDDDDIKFFNLSWLPGNLTRKEVVARYAQLSGRNTSNILYYYVFGLYKNAVIAQQIYARWKRGYTRDPRFGSLISVIRALGNRTQQALATESI